MKFKKFIYILLFAFSSLNISFLRAVVAGSSESVSVQSFTTFPAADADNEMKDFGWFKNGFALENASTTCIFNSIYPASGAMALNGGTLILNQDLVFKDFIDIQSLGIIIGNGRNLDFSSSTPIGVTPTSGIFQDVNVFIGNDFVIADTYVLRGNCSIFGDEHTITLIEGLGFLVVDQNSHVTFRNVDIKGLNDQNIRCVDDSGSITLHKVNLTQEGDFEFSKGSILFEDQVNWTGTFTFAYESSQSSTIANDAQLTFDLLTAVMGRFSDSASNQPLIFSEHDSILNLVNATLISSDNGVQYTKGTIAFTGDVHLISTSTLDATAMTFGNNNISDDLSFMFGGGSSVNFSKGLFVFDDVGLSLFRTAVLGGTILRGSESIFQINQDRQLRNLTLVNQPGQTTILAPGKTVLFENVIVQETTGNYVITGRNLNAMENLLSGNDSIQLRSGFYSLFTTVQNTNNIFGGSGIVNAPITLQNSSTDLNWQLNGQLGANIILNGGTIDLLSDINCANTVKLTGSGNVYLNGHNLNLGYVDYVPFTNSEWIDAISWTATPESVINLNSNLVLANEWTFSGTCRINGNGSPLDLDAAGELVVQPNSVLLLHNITVNNIKNNNIRCVDNSGVILLDNVRWNQSGDFNFTNGLLVMQGDVSMNGDAIFAFQSNRPCTVSQNTNLILNTMFTFSYDASSPDLMQFVDRSAQITLNAGTLYATSQGLNLKVGSLNVNSAGGTFASEMNGITLGDCFTSTNDFACSIAGGAQFEVTQGSLNYKNVDLSSWTMFNTFSTLKIAALMTLNLYQSLDLGQGLCIFGENAVLGRAPGKDIFGSITQEGTLNFVDLPSC